MKIGEKLKELRLLNDLDRESAATAIGIATSTLAHWENNRSEPPFDKLEALSHLYRTTIGDFFGDDDPLPLEVQNTLIEDVVNSLIKDGTLEDGKAFEDLDKASQQIIQGAINKIINKVLERNKKDSNH